MSEHDPEALQFDNAEFDATAPPPGPTCAACKRPIPDAYYELFGAVVCESCRDVIIAGRQGGSKLGRFLRATVYGTAAAVAGCALYYAVLKIANIHLSLISVLVGIMVGKGVQKGSNARGGAFYQMLAVFLTYSSIVATFSAAFVVPMIMKQIEARNGKAEAPKVVNAKAKDEGEKGEANKAEIEADEEDAPDFKGMSAGQIVMALTVGLAAVIGILYSIPIQAGLGSPMLLLIIGFALWEAWKINKRVPLVINGPFLVGGGGDEVHPEAEGHV